MFLATKAACAGIVFLLLAAGATVSQEVPPVARPNDVKKIQEALQDNGQYGGKVDGVFGLRTRASIRGFQKAENLPVTGQLDAQTAGKLGVSPEGREELGDETTRGKPSAGVKKAKGSRRTTKTPPKALKTLAAPEGSDGKNTLQAQHENHPE
jgi:peptidoglycan hydrolase-like protein with peptidoglycan-binding domain